MRYVPLAKINQLIFADAPVSMPKLQRWCRIGALPARRFGKEWRVDIDGISNESGFGQLDPVVVRVREKLSAR
jgi:hypothetical protein